MALYDIGPAARVVFETRLIEWSVHTLFQLFPQPWLCRLIPRSGPQSTECCCSQRYSTSRILRAPHCIRLDCHSSAVVLRATPTVASRSSRLSISVLRRLESLWCTHQPNFTCFCETCSGSPHVPLALPLFHPHARSLLSVSSNQKFCGSRRCLPTHVCNPPWR
jgi:hypothetical protein